MTGWLCSGPLILLAIAVAVLATVYLLGKRREAYYEKHGTPAIGWIVHADDKLYQPSAWPPSAYATVLVIEGPKSNQYREEFFDFASRIKSLKPGEQNLLSNPEEIQVANWIADKRPAKERRRIPKSVSGGLDAWLMSIRVARDFLPSDKLTHPFVRTLVLWNEPNKNPLIAHYDDADEKYRLNDGTKAKSDRKRMSLIGIASGRKGRK